MTLPRFAFALAAAVAVLTAAHAQTGAGAAAKSVVTTDQVRAELMAHAPEGVEPGKPVWVGLQITHKPEWHTYWKNSGDSGLPTVLEWTLPAGVTAGDIAWPTPKKIPIGTLANYGYEGTVVLPVPLTITPQFKPGLLSGELDIKLKAAWLVCKKECIPEEGEFVLKLPVKSTTAINGAAFDAAFKAQPKPLAADTTVRPGSQVQIDGNTIKLTVHNLPVALRGKTLDVFPETPEVIETAATPTQGWTGAVWTASVPLSAQRSNSPSVMPFVLASGAEAYRAELKVLGTWPTVAAAATVSPALDAALKANAAQASSAPSLTLAAALLGALIGGLILNLMPCVFPVLAIKVVGFTQHASDARAHRRAGVAYTAGVIVSFMALGALMLGLRAAGESIGWGFQLQSPAVVAALGGAVHRHRAEPGGRVRVRQPVAVGRSVAAGQKPHARFVPVGCTGRGHCLALHGTVHGCVAGFCRGAAGRAGAAGVCRHWRGHGPALPAGQLGARRSARAAAPGRMDGHLPQADGVPDVCHRGLAGLGAGPAKRH